MILEGIVTTISSAGEINIAPMGPSVDSAMTHLLLRPFRTAQTFRNLKARGEGVFHVTDNVLLLARAAIGTIEPVPSFMPASKIHGHILTDACRFYEFRVTSIDERDERSRIEVDVVHSGRLRDFFGFNRAKHAVVEAAILATRSAFLPLEDVREEFQKLEIIVQKTGGEQEKDAFTFLANHLAQVARPRGESPG